MRQGLLILLGLLLAAPALAEGRLAEMDRHLQDLRAVRLPAEPQAMKAELMRTLELLGELRRLSDQPPPHQREQARLRMGEGYLHLARALLEVPCPDGLDADGCAVWASELAMQADPMLVQVEALLVGTDPAKLAEPDRVRLQESYELLAELRGEPSKMSDPPGLPDEAPPDEGPVLYSLVWADARFQTHRSGLGQEVRDRDWFGDRAGHLGETLLVRVVARHNALTEVEVAPVEAWRHCVDDPPVDDAYRIRLFVRPEDVALLVGEPFVLRHEDGTSVEVNRGVPWLDGHVYMNGLVLPLPELPIEYVGVAYEPPPRWRGPRRDLGALPGAANPTLGGQPVQIRGRWPPRAEDWADGLATFASPCGTAVVRSDVAPVEREPGGVVGGMSGAITILRAAAETPLLWPDGAAAGHLAEPRTFIDSRLSIGDLRCFDLPFGRELEGRKRPDVLLCLRGEDLSPVQ